MSGDEYRPGKERTLAVYPGGLKAGDRLRLKRDLQIRDHEGRETGEVLSAGPLWTVVHGLPDEPEVLWLHEPEGDLHTWSEPDAADAFDLVASAPPPGAVVALKIVPQWAAQLPEEGRELVRLCVGQPLRVVEIERNGLIVLDASIFDAAVGGSFNDLRVEAELVEPTPEHAA